MLKSLGAEVEFILSSSTAGLATWDAVSSLHFNFSVCKAGYWYQQQIGCVAWKKKPKQSPSSMH